MTLLFASEQAGVLLYAKKEEVAEAAEIFAVHFIGKE